MGLSASKIHRQKIEIQKLNNMNKILVDKVDAMADQQVKMSKQYDQLTHKFKTYKKYVQGLLSSKEIIQAYINRNESILYNDDDDNFEKDYLMNFLLYVQKSIPV